VHIFKKSLLQTHKGINLLFIGTKHTLGIISQISGNNLKKIKIVEMEGPTSMS